MTRTSPSIEPRDEPPFAIAEIALAVALEYLGGGIAGGVLDFRIAIDEGQAEAPREPPPDRRLSNPHQPDQHDRPVETLSQIHCLKGYTAASPARQKPPPCPDRSCSSSSLVIVIGGLFFLSTVPKEQPTHTIEVAVPTCAGGNAH